MPPRVQLASTEMSFEIASYAAHLDYDDDG
jgi:hypothetical protein